jgi:hypothetical protein
MEKLFIKETEDSPRIEFDYETKLFEISGRSLPENAIGFYEPVLNWLVQYSSTPLDLTIMNFKLEYFNTSSAKQLAKILLMLEKLSVKGHKVIINWYYQKEDTDMYASGNRFSKLISLNFSFIEM